MSAEYRTHQVTTPVGVTAANPQVTALPMPARIVRFVEVRVPPGPNGNLGFAFGAAGQPIIPYNIGAFIITSDEMLHWDLSNQITSGAWQVFTYNTGNFPHTIYIRFGLDLPQPPAGLVIPNTAAIATLTSASAGG